MRDISNDNNIMIDLETMDDKSTSSIISIGAVKFGKEITNSFYEIVDLQSCIDTGLTVGAATVLWWLKQDKKAREEFDVTCLQLAQTLHLFKSWIGENAIVWGNGASFDNVVLSNAYLACGIDRPWRYQDERCYRTLFNLFPDCKTESVGEKHRAIDDATTQALTVIAINQKYGVGG